MACPLPQPASQHSPRAGAIDDPVEQCRRILRARRGIVAGDCGEMVLESRRPPRSCRHRAQQQAVVVADAAAVDGLQVAGVRSSRRCCRPSNSGRARSPKAAPARCTGSSSSTSPRTGTRRPASPPGFQLHFVDAARGQQLQHRIEVEAPALHRHGDVFDAHLARRLGVGRVQVRSAHRPRARDRGRPWPGPDPAPPAAVGRSPRLAPAARSVAGRRRARCRRRSGSRRCARHWCIVAARGVAADPL